MAVRMNKYRRITIKCDINQFPSCPIHQSLYPLSLLPSPPFLYLTYFYSHRSRHYSVHSRLSERVESSILSSHEVRLQDVAAAAIVLEDPEV